MRWAALGALCGCNALLGLDGTRPQPVFFDAMTDAPFTCPSMGAPKFTSGFTQILSGGACSAYTASRATDTALVACTESAGGPTHQVLLQGAVDSDKLLGARIEPALLGGSYAPALSPEADEIWIGAGDGGTGSTISVYTPATDSTPDSPAWMWSRDVWASADSILTVGTPTRTGPSRHVMFMDSATGLHELVLQANGSWLDMPPTGGGKISRIAPKSAPNLSPDGLRMVFAGTITALGMTDGVIYASRNDPATPFTYDSMVIIAGPPAAAETPFLTEDCSRVYFSGLDSVFYVTEEL